jgi:hypothetical protein
MKTIEITLENEIKNRIEFYLNLKKSQNSSWYDVKYRVMKEQFTKLDLITLSALNECRLFDTIQDIENEENNSYFIKIHLGKYRLKEKHSVQLEKYLNKDEKELINIDYYDNEHNILYVSKRYRNFKAEKEQALNEWQTITAIEKVAEFISNFIKGTGIKSHKVISDIMDNLHKYCEYDFDNLEFKKVEFIKLDDKKEFATEIILMDHSRSHSWAGSEGVEETGDLLYSSDSSFAFGRDYENEHSNNGQAEKHDEEYDEGRFNTTGSYVILKKKEGYFHYNNNGDTSNDYTSYKCIAYVGDESVYNFEHEEIINKYNIGSKVMERLV